MGELLRRWRVAIVLVGSACALIAVAILTLGGQRAPVAPNAAVASSSPRVTPSAPPPMPASVTAPAALAPSPSVSASTTSSWPKPEPIPGVTATWDPSFGDPFESKAGRPSDVREIVRVGGIRLGVTNASKVKNEQALAAVLRELGAEIDAKDHGRTDDAERRMLDYHPIYERYRAKLEPHLDGAFALKGYGGWTDTEPVRWPDGGAEHAH